MSIGFNVIFQLCDKSFTKKSHLTRHMTIHGIIEPVSPAKKEKEKQVNSS